MHKQDLLHAAMLPRERKETGRGCRTFIRKAALPSDTGTSVVYMCIRTLVCVVIQPSEQQKQRGFQSLG